MAGAGAGLGIRVFLEGVEIPAISVQVQAQANSPCTCAIQVPPAAAGTKLLPRTLVHVFFADFHELSVTTRYRGSPAPAGWDSLGRGRSEDGEVDKRSKAYKLLFVGEVVGFNWTKAVLNRSLVLQCVDLSNYWDYAYQWKNSDLFGPGYKAAFSGGGTNLFTSFLFGPASILTSVLKTGMRSGSIQYPKIKGLMGGVLRMLEKVGGAYYGRDAKEFKGANPFFALAELRLHITQMIVAYEDDPTANRLLGGGFFGMFGRTLGNLGTRVSIRDAINALMPVIFHATYPQPCPYFKPGTEGLISGDIRQNIDGMAEYSRIVDFGSYVQGWSRTMIKQLSSDGAVNYTDGTTYSPPATRRKVATSFRWFATEARTEANKLRNRKGTAGVRQRLVSISTKMHRGSRLARLWSPNGKQNSRLISILKQLDREGSALCESQVVTTPSKELQPARLCQQIFRPDIWFGAPPMCNVIFPDQYTNLNYSRMFLQEPTRLMLKTHNEFYGPNMLTDRLYYAPRDDLIRKGSRSKNVHGMMRNDLMEHELYTGILPMFEKMGEWAIFAARAGKINGKHTKVGMAQRTTNFLFFKRRFESRRLTANLYFNPYIAVGFPGLLIDRYMDKHLIKRHAAMMDSLGHIPADAGKYFGNHFLGNVARVQHSLMQGSAGQTMVEFTYAREPDESVEFMGIDKDQTVEKRFGDDAHRSTDVAAINPPKLGAIGPAFGEITAFLDVTNEYATSGAEDAAMLPLYSARRKGRAALPKVPVGLTKKPHEYGKSVAKLLDSDTPTSFRAYRVYERVPRYRSEVVDLPAEEWIRPGWYGDIWHPGSIGKVYREFLGTSAITDPTQVGDPAGFSSGDSDKEAADAFQATSVSNIDPTQGFDDAPAIMSIPMKRVAKVNGKDVNYISIKDAVDFLVQVYSYVKQGGLSANNFVTSYTWRPIATMFDMFGSESLEYDPTTGKPNKSGVEGFHSRAFGQFEDVFTLLPPDVARLMGTSKWGSNSAFATRADTRKKKQDAVLAYLSSVKYTTGLLG